MAGGAPAAPAGRTGRGSASVTGYLLRKGKQRGEATGFLIFGGNTFGIAAPIVTGYMLSMTGNFNNAFFLAGGLLLCGALLSLSCTIRPIGADDFEAVSPVLRRVG
jgi:MFS transporter, ACS family, D-galactonate transporter